MLSTPSPTTSLLLYTTLLTSLLLAPILSNPHSLDPSCRAIELVSTLLYTDASTQSIDIPAVVEGRVVHPFSPDPSYQLLLTLDASVHKQTFQIQQTNHSQADSIANIRVAPTDPQLLTTVYFTPPYEQNTTSVHFTYYCAQNAYGLARLSLTLQFQNCPDIFISWQKQCGKQMHPHPGFRLEMMVGGTGHKRYPLIHQGIVQHASRSPNSRFGVVRQAGYQISRAKLISSEKIPFLRTAGHDYLSLLIINTQQEPFNLEKVSVLAEQEGLMHPTLAGPGSEKIRIEPKTQVPLLLSFNCVAGRQGEGWVDLTFAPSYYEPMRVQFFHECSDGMSIFKHLKQDVVEVEHFILYDILLGGLVLALFLLAIYLVYSLCFQKPNSVCHKRLRGSNLINFCASCFSLCMDRRCPRRVRRTPQQQHSENIQQMGFILQEERPLTDN